MDMGVLWGGGEIIFKLVLMVTQSCEYLKTIFFFGQLLWKFLGQGSNPDLGTTAISCCSENTGSLIHGATRELLKTHCTLKC